jgi:hypothetical protein
LTKNLELKESEIKESLTLDNINYKKQILEESELNKQIQNIEKLLNLKNNRKEILNLMDNVNDDANTINYNNLRCEYMKLCKSN